VSRPVGIAVAALCALLSVTTATAVQDNGATIEPWERVNGMLVVQAPRPWAETQALFGHYCAPDILESGRVSRTCSEVPRMRRLFVGYGVWGSKAAISKLLHASAWNLWIDGRRVRLDAFGTADRTLHRYPPAGLKDVTLREWSVALARPTPGRHTIRYRFRLPQGVVDATWTFSVART
jgi:hypothetical protein